MSRFHFSSRVVLLAAGVWLGDVAAGAQERSGVTNQPVQALRAPEWSPSQLKEVQHDWIQLKSGEWLKGRFRGMQSDRLNFYSEELHEQEFDWDKVIQLHTVKPVELLLPDRSTVRGRVRVSSQYLVINEDAIVPQLFERDEIVAISPGGTKEIDRWSVDITFGMSIRAGNTEQADFNSDVELKRVTAGTRLVMSYQGYSSKASGQTIANNQRGTVYFDRWFTSRLYWRVGQVEYYRDPFQNLDARITAGTGLGYDIVRSAKLDWHASVGPAVQRVRYVSVAPGQDTEITGPAGFFTTLAEIEITRRIDLNLEYSNLMVGDKLGGVYHHGEITFEVDLTSLLDLDISFIWDRVSDPIPNSSGVTPKQDDFRLVTSLSLEF